MSQKRIAEPFVETLLPAGEVTPKLSVIVRLLEQNHITRASSWKKDTTGKVECPPLSPDLPPEDVYL